MSEERVMVGLLALFLTVLVMGMMWRLWFG